MLAVMLACTGQPTAGTVPPNRSTSFSAVGTTFTGGLGGTYINSWWVGVTSIRASPHTSGTVYGISRKLTRLATVAGGPTSQGGCYRSTNYGADWTKILDNRWMRDCQEHPSVATTLYATSSSATFAGVRT